MASRIPQRLRHSTVSYRSLLVKTRSYSIDASFEPPVSRLRDRIKSYWPAFLAWTIFGSEALHLLWLRQDYKNYKEKTTTHISILNNVIQKLENGQEVDLEKALYTGDFRQRSTSQTPIDKVDYSSAADDKEWIKFFDQAIQDEQDGKVQYSPSSSSTPLQPERPSAPPSPFASPPASSSSTSHLSSTPPTASPFVPSAPQRRPDTSKFY